MMIKKAIVYQIRVWCCEEDSGMEFWFDKELSDLYEDKDEAEKELKKISWNVSIRTREKVRSLLRFRK